MDHDAHQAMADMASKQKLSQDTLRLFRNSCTGNCNQGRRCDCLPEMACTAGEDNPNTWRLRGAGALGLVLFAAWVGYWFLPTFN